MITINKIIFQDHENHIKKTDKYFYRDGKIADKVLKYCTTCKKVWEKYNYKGNTNFFFYDNQLEIYMIDKLEYLIYFFLDC